jgi:hypothetical protein
MRLGGRAVAAVNASGLSHWRQPGWKRIQAARSGTSAYAARIGISVPQRRLANALGPQASVRRVGRGLSPDRGGRRVLPETSTLSQGPRLERRGR